MTLEPCCRFVFPFYGESLTIFVGEVTEHEVSMPIRWIGSFTELIQEVESWIGKLDVVVIVVRWNFWQGMPIGGWVRLGRRPCGIVSERGCRLLGHGGC